MGKRINKIKIHINIKRLLVCITMIFSLVVMNFAAVVTDNDGSAFISKAEFDSLKNDFQSQLNEYNVNIDSKIDDAISAYLTGIVIQKKSELTNLYNSMGGSRIRWYTNSTLWASNVKRPKAELAPFFYVWPSSSYYSKYRYHYYRINTPYNVVSENSTTGGGVITKVVGNSNSLVPQQTKLGLIQYKVEDGLNKLVKYFKYAHLYEAWCIWFWSGSSNPGNWTIYFNFSPYNSSKSNVGQISAGNIDVEASACRVVEKTSDEQDLDYATCSDTMNVQHIMVNDTEYGRYSYNMNSTSTIVPESDSSWTRVRSYSSYGSSRFNTFGVQYLCDYKYTTESASSTTWHKKPWELLNFGYATKEYPVKLYEGIPLCKSKADGTITVSSLRTNRTSNIYFAISDKPFANEKINGNVTLNDSEDGSYSLITDGGKKYYQLNKQGAKLAFKSKKGTSYYIKFWYSGSLSQWQYTTATIGTIEETSDT